MLCGSSSGAKPDCQMEPISKTDIFEKESIPQNAM